VKQVELNSREAVPPQRTSVALDRTQIFAFRYDSAPKEQPMAEQTATASPAADKTQIAYDEFAKLDLRVATIKQAEFHPKADRLLKIQLDDGTPGGRQVCAGIRAWYTEPAKLVGRQVVIVANLEPRMIRGEISQGMILAASDMKAAGEAPGPEGTDEKEVVLLCVDKPVKAGSTVS
jgi:methionyl-tRNA synthetase